MNPLAIIEKYYASQPELHKLLLAHSTQVAKRALRVADAHPELGLDRQFLMEAALLHDIGIIRTNAERIFCFGTEPYICHGYLGAEMMRAEGFPRHALVCERHTGTGLTLQQIIDSGWPLPHRDMQPLTPEEQVICFADKFYSKTRLDHEKSVEEARQSLMKFGEEGIKKFDLWCTLFG
ncbi:MAG: HDIG domain-containing protein [Bacteroidaceae bacterium]|nr:HDIG domain-containing protein [Bacteroidaceae bacterium]